MTQPRQADIYAALSALSSFRKPPVPTAAYTSFSDPSTKLITPGSGPSGSLVNKTRVYCFREGCGSLIMMDKAGEVLETEEDILPYDPNSPFPPPSSSMNEKAEKRHYIHIPSPFGFENIGYSRPDTSTTLPPGTPGLGEVKGTSKGKVKWLICAECDLGPVGWAFEDGQGSLVDMRRVRYKVEGEKG